MLFNSYEFLFAFLPITLIGFFLIGQKLGRAAAIAWLIFASLFYYAWWNPIYVGLILASMGTNFLFGRAIGRRDSKALGSRRALLALGVIFNLSLLGYFKYANFFVDTANELLDVDVTLAPIVLPLAISFFTFQQIAYLADTYSDVTSEYSFLHYALFVTFFPQLIAGPIVHHSEMMPQFMHRAVLRLNTARLCVASAIFSIGLFKKVVIADGVARYASPVFAAAAAGETLDLFEAWGGALAYTFQLYFDFSGYSDMAVGIALMFGIKLPLNFFSPYKATNIVEFWRRWHMTLSRFLRDYVYIPLGGNRHGQPRRYANLMATMLLGGLWHGAGWTFVFWGGLHGTYLVINHAWNWLIRQSGLVSFCEATLWRSAAWGITFLAVVIAWVFFRATSFDAAITMLQGMSGMNGVSIPQAISARLGSDVAGLLADLGIRTHLGGGTNFVFTWLWIVILFPLVILAPNTFQLTRRFKPTVTQFGKETEHAVQPMRRFTLNLQWRPTMTWAGATSLIAVAAILGLSSISEFLYFQF